MLLNHIGLTRPYRFDRLIVALLAGLLVVIVVAALITLHAMGQYTTGSPREHYFLYLAALALLAVGLARWPRWAALPLSLAFIDFGLGIGSFALERPGGRKTSLLPSQYYDPPRFAWHPLLQAVPIPSIERRVVSLVVGHSSQRTRGRDHSRHELARKRVVAVFGGSTTYDVSVSDHETWAHRLEELLGPGRFAVINHGVPGYTTAEHLIQTAFYQDKFGTPPHCAIYYVGWNDLRNAFVPNLDPGYADFHLRSQIDGLQVRRIGAGFTTVSPLATLLVRTIASYVDTARPAPILVAGPHPKDDPALEAIFLRNIRSISAINRSRGIRTVWVGQVLNAAAFGNDDVDGWLPMLRNREVLPLLNRFKELLHREASALHDGYVDVPEDTFQSADFRDNGHFVASGSLKFARQLAPLVRKACDGTEPPA